MPSSGSGARSATSAASTSRIPWQRGRRAPRSWKTTRRRLAAAGFDALHFEGQGTDLVVGLFRGAEWQAARDETVDGIVHMANLPSEEVLTTPDPERTEGVVRSTRPLVLGDGPIMRGLVVRFEGGRAVEITAERAGR